MSANLTIAAAERIIAFAKANGFPKAEILYWDRDNLECGYDSIYELMEDSEECRIALGISLNAQVIVATRTWDETAGELGPVEFQPDPPPAVAS